MEEKVQMIIEKYVDTSLYPLNYPQGESWQDLIQKIRDDLDRDGVCVLRKFIRPEWHALLEKEGEEVAPGAYYQTETVNAYNLPLDADLPGDHPAKITMKRGNAFVARDLIPEQAIIHQLYNSEALLGFLACCFQYETLHRLEDPLAGLCMNVLQSNCSHPWHFDINEFTISMLTKKPQGGGVFKYCPNIRSPLDENLDDVKSVLTDGQSPLIHNLALEVGDLQLFKGRFALHHVSPVEGDVERHSAIFAYTLEPGVVGGVERTKQLFGRTLPAHELAEKQKIRADHLLD